MERWKVGVDDLKVVCNGGFPSWSWCFPSSSFLSPFFVLHSVRSLTHIAITTKGKEQHEPEPPIFKEGK